MFHRCTSMGRQKRDTIWYNMKFVLTFILGTKKETEIRICKKTHLLPFFHGHAKIKKTYCMHYCDSTLKMHIFRAYMFHTLCIVAELHPNKEKKENTGNVFSSFPQNIVIPAANDYVKRKNWEILKEIAIRTKHHVNHHQR